MSCPTPATRAHNAIPAAVGNSGSSASVSRNVLKDRVSDLAAFASDIRRVASGDCVIDAELVARLVNKKRERDPLADLTDQERKVLALMAQGRSNSALCAELHLSGKTIEAHVRSIFTKLGLPPDPGDHRRVLAVLTFLRS
jgi:DNA-binding NarL/FixJ family response regulator